MILVVLLSIVLALLCYAFYVFRMELFRISERQSNMIMHVARMNRGLLSGIGSMFEASRETDRGADNEDAATGGEDDTVVEEEPIVQEVVDGTPEDSVPDAATVDAESAVDDVGGAATPPEAPLTVDAGALLKIESTAPNVVLVEPVAVAERRRKKKPLNAIPETAA